MNELVLGADQALIIPRPNGTKPLVLDMRMIFKAEGRLFELQGVTKAKAGELIGTYIKAWDESKNYLSVLNGELLRAKEKLKEVRGLVVLDRAPEVLSKRGLSSARSPAGSEDLRDAVVHTDTDYKAAVECLAQVTTAAEYMDGKVEKFKMAYFAVNKLIDSRDPNANTSGGSGDDEIGGFTSSEKVERFVASHSAVDTSSYESTGFGPAKL